jgi:hypothetical protein
MVSVRAPHYCPGCGYDYWRSAAGGLTLAPPLAAPAAAQADGQLSAILMVAGLVGLVITSIVTALVVLGGMQQQDAPPQIANTLPSRGPEDFLILRFFREARDPRAAFTVDSEATLRQIEPAIPDVTVVTESIVVHGEDWIVHSTAVTGEESDAYSVTYVDGRYYLREGAEVAWTEVEVFGDDRPASPFARISAVSEIEYVGLETNGGISLHHLLVTRWLGGAGVDFRMLGFDRVTERENRFEIWVNDDGVPIRARHEAGVVVFEEGVPYVVMMEAEMTFRDWGIVEPIQPPTNPEEPSVQGTIGAPPVPRTRSRPSGWPRPRPSGRRPARSRAAAPPRRVDLPPAS